MKREIAKLSSVFDVNIHQALDLADSISVRVLLRYDRKENRKEFTVLAKEMEKETHSRIVAWLVDNVDVSDVTCRYLENALEADQWSLNSIAN